MTNTTITKNSAEFGGGVYDAPDDVQFSANPIHLKNTLVASNTAAASNGPGPDCLIVISLHNIESLGNNLIGNPIGCRLTAQPTDQFNVDPLLAPLHNNGGATWTHALLPGSPAIDKGDNSGCPATDQRGSGRPIDGDNNGSAICDIGAYEATWHFITSLNPPTVQAGSPGLILTITGQHFSNGMLVRWNGLDRTATFISSTQLTVSLNVADVATASGIPVSVFDPAINGLSNPAIFVVSRDPAFLPVILK